VRDAAGNDFGIQVTFFRTRPGVAEDNSSAFAPRQLLLRMPPLPIRVLVDFVTISGPHALVSVG
jgi:hypothetical protein